MNRFFVSKDSFHGNKVLLGKDHAHQIRSVLRISVGDHIVILDNQGSEYDVVLTKIRHDEVVGEVTQKRQAAGEPSVQIALFQSLLTREKFEFVLQKGTEVGVSRFVPVITQRTLVRETAIKPEKLDRWQRIITEAAEQSHRGRIPDLSPPVSFEMAIQKLSEFERCLIASESAEVGQHVTLRQALRTDKQTSPGTIAILVGPEGGFTEQEVELAKKNGAIPITLGPRILRTETAAVVAATLILYESGQMER
jgi:16S rRNA (uracil1498-N3)-methyltransferase